MTNNDSLILRNAKVLDPRAGTVDGPRDVFIADGRIAAVGASPPAGTEEIDLKSLTLMPDRCGV